MVEQVSFQKNLLLYLIPFTYPFQDSKCCFKIVQICLKKILKIKVEQEIELSNEELKISKQFRTETERVEGKRRAQTRSRFNYTAIKHCHRISTRGRIEKEPRNKITFTAEHLIVYGYVIPRNTANHIDGMCVGPVVPCFITLIWHLSVELHVCKH